MSVPTGIDFRPCSIPHATSTSTSCSKALGDRRWPTHIRRALAACRISDAPPTTKVEVRVTSPAVGVMTQLWMFAASPRAVADSGH